MRILLRRVTAAVLISISGIAGCEKQYIYLEPRMPIIPTKARPTLRSVPAEELACLDTDVRQQLLANYDRLMGYAVMYEVAVTMYNEHAAAKNRENGFPD